MERLDYGEKRDLGFSAGFVDVKTSIGAPRQ
jgi:hypothetical protein